MHFLCYESQSIGLYNPVNTICEPYLGIEGIEFKEIKIYPNPAIDFLQIESLTDKTIISIYSMVGKLHKSLTASENGIVNINDLAEGIYIIKLQTEKGVIYGKFIKQ